MNKKKTFDAQLEAAYEAGYRDGWTLSHELRLPAWAPPTGRIREGFQSWRSWLARR